MNYQSPLARARGLGAAGVGSHEWWRQRVTAIALVPLSFWFALSVARLPGLDYAEVRAWIAMPWNSILLLSFIIIVAYHTLLGLQVVIEDYVHTDWVKMLALLSMKLVFAFLALAALYATLRIIFMD
ncbi:succinate dehydrogenase, hydrophobic membrane anchor protein [Candidatus Methylocalor cossyra]|uniref:Succinate dehydrogenase hydrophobic membrane anchor subunit n=1 Tax=Candidatus Methylocalor cossyra TaxID=3108543 RepID=A0ABM9NGC8_9GAMM